MVAGTFGDGQMEPLGMVRSRTRALQLRGLRHGANREA